ncbi:MAG: hypothetical protein K0S14_2116, partial [Thermomicrobiales bacterium]|nr:hypothetical protein [Thermomicrobiales bacterium]
MIRMIRDLREDRSESCADLAAVLGA